MPVLSIKIDTRGGAGGPRVPAGARGGNRPGTFTDAQRGFTARNYELAQRIQAQVVVNITERTKRREASTGRLLNVTSAKGNIFASASRVNVGIESFLEKSIAKYWRTIEYGSAQVWARPFTGTQLYPVGPGKAPFPVARNGRPGLRTFGGEDKPWMDGDRYVVKHEIAPMHAYRDAADMAHTGAIENIRDLLKEIHGLPFLDPDA